MKYPQVYIGKIEPYSGSSPSAIGKRQVQGGIMLTSLGLEGDEQAETRFHGGPDRALCHYPREHYAHWMQQFPEQAEIFSAPAYGENISTLGMTEQNVFMGDIYRWGEALIQVTQPRSTYLTFKKDRKVIAAQDDAGSFVASNGSIRGPYLESAMQQVRADNPQLNVSDMELANAILAKNATAE